MTVLYVQCVVNKLLQIHFHQNSTKSILLLQTKNMLIVPNIMQMAVKFKQFGVFLMLDLEIKFDMLFYYFEIAFNT